MKKNQDNESYYIKKFEAKLKTTKGTHFSILNEFYATIAQLPLEEQLSAFTAICEIYGSIKPEDGAKVHISPYQEKLKDLRERKANMIEKKIDLYVNKNFQRRAFYKRCYEFIFHSKSMKAEEERVFAFYMLIMDRRIPYYPYDRKTAYQMQEERFRSLLTETRVERRRLQNYIHRSFPQKTMQASAILDVMGIFKPQEGDKEAISKYEKMLIEMCFILFFTK